MEIEVIREDQGLAKFWPLSSFNEAYDKEEGIRKVLMTSLSSDYGNPDKTAILVFRLFIENKEKLKEGQKYVLALRFYNFGDLVTLDLISLEKAYHKNIASEHISRMKLPLNEEDLDDFEKTRQSPFLLSGAFVELKEDKLVFSSSSQDYSSSLFFADCNEVSRHLCSLCDLSVSKDPKNLQGHDFLHKILSFVLENKKQNNFYEKFVMEALKVEDSLSAQQISSLLNMKVFDRSIKEKKPFIQIMVEEMSEGFSRSVMLHSIAKRLR